MKKIIFIFLTSLLLLTFHAQAQEQEPVPDKEQKTTKTENLITNEFSVFYLNDYQILKNNNISGSGWHKNQLKTSGQILFYPWLIKGSIMGNRSDMKLDSFEYNPVFSWDTFDLNIGINQIWKISEQMEWGLGLNYFYYDYKPDNKNKESDVSIPYTNSYLDFHQTRHGLGINGFHYWKLLESLSLCTEATLYPYLFTYVEQQPDSMYLLACKANISLRYTIIEGFLTSLFYSNTLWYGTNIFENNNTIGIGLTLVPSRIKEE